MRRTGWCLALLLSITACAVGDDGEAPLDELAVAGPQEFIPGSMVAGGAVYMIVANPGNPDLLLSASDVAGIHRSTDGGDNFRTSNNGLTAPSDVQVATVLWSTRMGDSSTTAYMGAQTGVFRSTDGGQSWNKLATYSFSGNGHATPRQVGNLLATGGSYLFAGTQSAGLRRWNGSSWQLLGISGVPIQGIALASGTLYAAVGNGGSADGVWRVTGATTASPGAPQKMTGSSVPAQAWEVHASGSDVWVAATGYVYRLSGGAWTRWSPGDNATSLRWTALGSGTEGGQPVIYAGNDGGAKVVNGVTQSIYKFRSGVWSSMMAHTGARDIECDPQKPLWTNTYAIIGYPDFRAYGVSGQGGAVRAGPWQYDAASQRWCSTVDGMMVTGATNVAVDPTAPQNVYAATADYTLMRSASYGVARPGETGIEKLHVDAPAGTNGDRALSLAFDRQTGDVYLATGDRNVDANRAGRIWRFPRSNFGARTTIGSGLPDKRAWAVAVNRVSSSTCGDGAINVLAAVEGAGVYRKVGTGSFSKVSAGNAMASALGEFPHATLDWPWGSQVVFLSDPETGAWRSVDCGKSWQQISTRRSSHPYGGYLAYDAAGDTLYLSVASTGDTGNGIFRIAGAAGCTASGGNCSHAAIAAAPPRPGAVALDADRDLWVAGLPTASVEATIEYWDRSASAWVDRTNALYRGIGILPLRIATGRAEDGGQYIYVGFKGNAFIRGHK
jgi:hypothetical protein